jgi:hypothetical protein
MIFRHKNVNIPKAIYVKPKVREHPRTAAILLFYMVQKHSSSAPKVAIFLEVCCKDVSLPLTFPRPPCCYYCLQDVGATFYQLRESVRVPSAEDEMLSI